MPRTCLACSHTEREAIGKAFVAGEPLRNIAKRVSISPAGLLRHKSHVACVLAKAQERRKESLGDTIFDEMKRVLAAKAWELLGKMQAEGDHRGSIVALREVRECLESLNGLVTKAEDGSAGIKVIVEHIGNPAIARIKGEAMDSIGIEMERGQATSANQELSMPAALSPAALPLASSATEASGQSCATVPLRRTRPLVGAVGATS